MKCILLLLVFAACAHANCESNGVKGATGCMAYDADNCGVSGFIAHSIDFYMPFFK